MQDNNYGNKKQQSMFSVIATLLHHHREAASNYRSVAQALEDQDLVKWIKTLIDYHTDFGNVLQQWAEDLPDAVAPPALDKTVASDDDWSKVQHAISNDNLAKITSMIYNSEQAISDYYKEALRVEGMPMDFFNVLEEQHQKILAELLTAKDRATVNY